MVAILRGSYHAYLVVSVMRAESVISFETWHQSRLKLNK